LCVPFPSLTSLYCPLYRINRPKTRLTVLFSHIFFVSSSLFLSFPIPTSSHPFLGTHVRHPHHQKYAAIAAGTTALAGTLLGTAIPVIGALAVPSVPVAAAIGLTTSVIKVRLALPRKVRSVAQPHLPLRAFFLSPRFPSLMDFPLPASVHLGSPRQPLPPRLARRWRRSRRPSRRETRREGGREGV
jgi:hypothetical protein